MKEVLDFHQLNGCSSAKWNVVINADLKYRYIAEKRHMRLFSHQSYHNNCRIVSVIMVEEKVKCVKVHSACSLLNHKYHFGRYFCCLRIFSPSIVWNPFSVFVLLVSCGIYELSLFPHFSFLGKKGIEGFKRSCQAKITYRRSCGETASHKYPSMHADSLTCAVSDSFKEDQNVRGESGSPKTTPTKACQRDCNTGLCYISLILYINCPDWLLGLWFCFESVCDYITLNINILPTVWKSRYSAQSLVCHIKRLSIHVFGSFR